MKTLLVSLVLTLALIFAPACADAGRTTLDIAGPVTPDYRLGALSSVYLSLSDNGACTGTIIGRRAILTATHCIDDGRKLEAVDGRAMTARVIANDGNDHAILRTSQDLEGRIAKVVLLPPVGTKVYIWGNTLGIRALLRTGYLAGRDTKLGRDRLIFDLNSWYGDSGSGVFDEHGNVVAVLTGGYGANSRVGSIKLMVCYEMKLTPFNLEVARL